MAQRIFNKKQALEKEVKELFAKMLFGTPTAPTLTLETSEPIVLTKASVGSVENSGTVDIEVEPADDNPTDTILVDVTGTEDAIVVTVTPNDGTNTGSPATAVFDLTTDVTVTTDADTSSRNTNTITLQVLAAAANPTDTIIANVTGTSAATVITITPNDGTNNAATPVDLTTAELAELISNGSVVGKNVTLTDSSNLLSGISATGGDSTALADGGEGDGVVATFSGGVNDAPVDLTTAELAELFDTGSVIGKNITLTDSGSLLDVIDSASGGDSTPLADSGEGDGVSGTWSGGEDGLTNESVTGIESVVRNNIGDYSIILQDAYTSLKSCKSILMSTSAADLHMQLHSESVNDRSNPEIRMLIMAGATPTDPADGVELLAKIELKNTSVI